MKIHLPLQSLHGEVRFEGLFPVLRRSVKIKIIKRLHDILISEAAAE
jgi:hypothetical protein